MPNFSRKVLCPAPGVTGWYKATTKYSLPSPPSAGLVLVDPRKPQQLVSSGFEGKHSVQKNYDNAKSRNYGSFPVNIQPFRSPENSTKLPCCSPTTKSKLNVDVDVVEY